MAALPPIRKLYLEDYASQKTWIGPFLIIMNQFMTAVVSALTKSLTLVDNSTSDIKTITLSTVPTASAPVGIAWTKPIAPIAVMVGNVKLSTGSFTLANAIQVQWTMGSGTLLITGVAGVTPTQTAQYTLTLICIAG